MTKAQKIALGIAAALVLAWWFRYDTHCSGSGASYGVACVAYDRFTGNWIFPYLEAKGYHEKGD